MYVSTTGLSTNKEKKAEERNNDEWDDVPNVSKKIHRKKCRWMDIGD
jgi:hypothetical protein